MRGVVIQILKTARLDPISVENPAYPGTPDVNYVGGWLELKKCPAWPVRPNTPLRIDHYTPQQKVWGLRRRRAGGRSHLLLQVKNDWLLFDADVAKKVVGCSPRNSLERMARAVWHGKASIQEGLVKCLFELQLPLEESGC